jgi:hypothetical protein
MSNVRSRFDLCCGKPGEWGLGKRDGQTLVIYASYVARLHPNPAFLIGDHGLRSLDRIGPIALLDRVSRYQELTSLASLCHLSRFQIHHFGARVWIDCSYRILKELRLECAILTVSEPHLLVWMTFWQKQSHSTVLLDRSSLACVWKVPGEVSVMPIIVSNERMIPRTLSAWRCSYVYSHIVEPYIPTIEDG